MPTEPGTIVSARVRPDGEIWYEWASGAAPYQLRSLNGRLGTQLPEPSGDAPTGTPYQDLEVGRLHGFLAEPPGSRPHPTIFLVHGGPSFHDSDAYSPRVQAWVDHGFAVVLVNYRGSTGYGRAWRDALLANPGFTELEDVARMREHVVKAGIADPERVVLAGRSWGGYLTLLGLGTQPELWRLGIAEVPVADYLQAFDDESEPLKATDRAIFGGSPAEVSQKYVERSPITYIDRLRVPVMITGGVNDPRCPIRQIETYIARLRELGKPHEFYRYEAGHASQVIDEQVRQEALKLDFAARHLGTAAPTD
jgi:dipeptidyl aminopeptidase/acylaminoacyl peptidase